MNIKDALRTLRLLKVENIDAVRKSYRKLALKYHPDQNSGDKDATEKFKRIKEAYDLILKTYKEDTLEDTDPGTFDKNPRPSYSTPKPRKKKGQKSSFHKSSDSLHLKYILHINLREAAKGCSKTVQYVRQSYNGDDEKVRIAIQVPAGVNDGQKLRIQSEGARDGRNSPGDLIIHVRVDSHKLFYREGRNVKMDLPLRLSEALLGAKKSIPTLYGFCELNIPPGTKSGQILRLKNKGFPRLNGFGRGDFLIRIFIDFPLELTSEEIKWIKKISKKPSPLILEYEDALNALGNTIGDNI